MDMLIIGIIMGVVFTLWSLMVGVVLYMDSKNKNITKQNTTNVNRT